MDDEKILTPHPHSDKPSPTTSDKPAQHFTIENVDAFNQLHSAAMDTSDFISVTRYSKNSKVVHNPTHVKCPFCQSLQMTVRTTPSGGALYSCPDCGVKDKNNFEIVAASLGLDPSTDRDEICRQIAEKSPSLLTSRANNTTSTPAPKFDENDIRQMIVDEIDFVQGTLNKLPKNQLRGFENDLEILEQRFKIGVNLNWTHPKMPNSRPTERFIVPLGDADNHISYNAIMTPRDRQKYKWEREQDNSPKWSDKCLTAGPKIVFNPQALNPQTPDEKVVPTSEGEFDALSIMKAFDYQQQACALGGAGQWRDLCERLAKMSVKPYILLINDNDDGGKNGMSLVAKHLAEIRVPAVVKNFEPYMTPEDIAKVGGKVDANAILQTLGSNYLKGLVTRVIVDVAVDLDELAEKYAAEEIFDDNEPGSLLQPRHMGRPKSKSSGNLRPEIQKLLDRINSKISAEQLVSDGVLVKSKGKYYNCPWCHSGEHQKGTGALQFYPNGGGVACHSCKAGGTIFQLIVHVKEIDVTGSNFYTQLRAIADKFHIEYDPTIFDFKSNAQKPIEIETPKFETATDDKINAWLKVNGGAVSPDVLDMLHDAEKFFVDITPEKITPELVRSSVTVQYLALVTFYDFLSPHVDKFWSVFDEAKNQAATQIKDAKAGLIENPSAEIIAVAGLSKRTLNQNVERKVKAVSKAHKKFIDEFNAKNKRDSQAKRKQEQLATEQAALDNSYLLEKPDHANYLLSQMNDDCGRAEQFAFLFNKQIRFLTSREQWLVFTHSKRFKGSGVWKLGNPMRNTIVMPLAGQMHKFLTANATPENVTPDTDSNIESWRNLKCINNAIRFAGATNLYNIQITAADLDNHPHLLLCQNGVIDLQTKKFYETVDKSLLITKCCNAIYNPQADSQLVYKFLADIQRDENTRAAMLRFIGYCATGDISQQIVHFWKGEGANGKSTLLAVLLYLFNSYGVKISSDLIADNAWLADPNSATPALASLIGARIAVSNELREDTKLNAKMVKDLSSGEPLPVRLLHCNAETFNPICKLIICGNFYPKIGNTRDKGLLRRLHTVEFTETFTGDKADLQLPKKLLLEYNLSTLLNVIVNAAFDFYHEGKLLESTAMKATRTKYISNNDLVQMFVDEYCLVGEEKYRVLAKDLVNKFFKVYSTGHQINNGKDLRDIFEKEFVIRKSKTRDGIEYTGITLVSDMPEGYEPSQSNGDDFIGEPVYVDESVFQ